MIVLVMAEIRRIDSAISMMAKAIATPAVALNLGETVSRRSPVPCTIMWSLVFVIYWWMYGHHHLGQVLMCLVLYESAVYLIEIYLHHGWLLLMNSGRPFSL